MIAPAANALTTVEVLKIHLKVGNATTPPVEDRLQLYINAASAKIESYCDRFFHSTAYVGELHSGRRQNYLLSRQYPIISVEELRIDPSRQWTSPTSLVPVGKYTVADDYQTLQLDGLFPAGFNNVYLSYTAGYATIPNDLAFGCIWLAEWYYRHAERADMGKTSMGKGDENIGILSKTPEMILEHLRPYKRTEFGIAESPIRSF